MIKAQSAVELLKTRQLKELIHLLEKLKLNVSEVHLISYNMNGAAELWRAIFCCYRSRVFYEVGFAVGSGKPSSRTTSVHLTLKA